AMPVRTRRRARSLSGVVYGAVVVALAGAGVWGVAHRRSKVETASSASAPIATAAAPRTVRLSVEATPENAHVRVDDGRWLDAPTTLEVTPDDRPHVIRARADGFIEESRDARFDADAVFRFSLQKVEPAAASASVRPTRKATTGASRPQGAVPHPGGAP